MSRKRNACMSFSASTSSDSWPIAILRWGATCATAGHMQVPPAASSSSVGIGPVSSPPYWGVSSPCSSCTPRTSIRVRYPPSHWTCTRRLSVTWQLLLPRPFRPLLRPVDEKLGQEPPPQRPWRQAEAGQEYDRQ